MTSDTSREVLNTSSSGATVVSLRSEKLIELGNRLVRDLGIDDSSDVLGRWMAHYLAELIEAAKTASAEARPAKLEKCSEAILNLWKHRHELPNGKRPFEGVEAILRALESLDPENETPRYYGGLRSAHVSENETEAQKWLRLADGFDYSARILIRYCLSQAAQSAVDKTNEWVALAEDAGLADLDIPIIRVIMTESDLLDKPEEALRKILEDRLKRLESFQTMTEGLMAHFRDQLAQLDVAKHKI
jgi:hypothetical protein